VGKSRRTHQRGWGHLCSASKWPKADTIARYLNVGDVGKDATESVVVASNMAHRNGGGGVMPPNQQVPASVNEGCW
jgi:hypothetical protein